MSDEIVLAVITVKDNPVPPVPSVQEWCSICAQEVWVSEDSARLTEAQRVCMDCLPGLAKTTGPIEAAITRETRERLNNLGMTNQQIDKLLEEYNPFNTINS